MRAHFVFTKLSVLLVSASVAACSGQSFPGSQLLENLGSKSSQPAPLKPLKAVSNVINTKKVWQIKTANSNRLSKIHPFINAQHVIVAGSGKVSAWDKHSGKLAWQTNIGELISAGVNGNDAQVFIGTAKGNAIALDAKTGKILWIERLNSELLAVSGTSHNRVVFRSIDGKLHGLTSNSGEIIWQQSQRTPALTLYGASVPRIIGQYVIAGFDNGKIATYTLATGKKAWEVAIAEPSGQNELERMVDIDGKLKVMGTALFASALNSSISGINMIKGEAVWARRFSSSTGVDADSQGLYSSDSKGNIWKFQPQTGQPVWKMDDLMRRQPSTPILAKPGLLIVADKQGNLHWINAITGKFVARNQGDPAGFAVAPVIDHSENAVYAFGKNGVLSKFTF